MTYPIQSPSVATGSVQQGNTSDWDAGEYVQRTLSEIMDSQRQIQQHFEKLSGDSDPHLIGQA